MFGMIQPALAKVESQQVQRAGAKTMCDGIQAAESMREQASAGKKAKGLLKDYGRVRGWLAKFGIEMQDDDEALGFPLLFAVIVCCRCWRCSGADLSS